MPTGDIRIDALVEASRSTLATNHQLGTGAVITYSFLSSPPQAAAVYDFRSLNGSQKSSVTAMLLEISSLTGITFKEVAEGGLLQYGSYTGRPGLANGPDNKAESVTDQTGSIVWLNWQVPEIANLDSGYGRQLVLHETAHALGLKHPEAYSSYDSGPFLPHDLANATNTIMAYNGGDTEHLGGYDLLALQHLWGSYGAQPLAANPITIDSANPSGSYFNDMFSLDVSTVASTIRITGLDGVDRLLINADSSKMKLEFGLNQLTYTKADGSLIGVFLDSVERVQFTDKIIALDVEGRAGQAYRLYKAAFDRTPDKGGLGYWINELDNGASLEDVAQSFVASQEFQTLNGVSPTNLQLASSLYNHVLGRAPDQAGLDYWVGQLDSHILKPNELLASFSESSENKIALIGQIESGIEYTLA